MTREEQIIEKAKEYYNAPNLQMRIGFIEGAKWADEHPYKKSLKTRFAAIMPKIRKIKPEELCDGMHLMGYKYCVESVTGNFMCFGLFHAVRIWWLVLLRRI